MADGTGETLPLTFDRKFQPWLYRVSHRTLVLRSPVAAGPEPVIEIEFIDVLAMKTRLRYDRLLIEDAGRDRPEIEDFVDIPERHGSRYLRLIVTDGVHEGFVVCGGFRVRRE